MATPARATDAANVSQVQSAESAAVSTSEAYTDTSAANTLSSAESYTDSRVAAGIAQSEAYTNARITQVTQQANASASAALAAAGLAQAVEPGKSLVTAGFGYWQGQGAFAAGLSHRIDEHWTVKASATFRLPRWARWRISLGRLRGFLTTPPPSAAPALPPCGCRGGCSRSGGGRRG